MPPMPKSPSLQGKTTISDPRTDAEYRRLLAESDKQRKLIAESEKLFAESRKLFAEELKFERERRWMVPLALIRERRRWRR